MKSRILKNPMIRSSISFGVAVFPVNLVDGAAASRRALAMMD
jgi:hypothetical protein